MKISILPMAVVLMVGVAGFAQPSAAQVQRGVIHGTVLDESGVLKGRKPWKVETSAADISAIRRSEQLMDHATISPQEMAEKAVLRGTAERPRISPAPTR